MSDAAPMSAQCSLCRSEREVVLWRDERCRVIEAQEPDYPGWCRVVWHAHVREMSDLPESERHHLMRVAYAVEHALREVLHPDKINLASLGNVVPHLHWHVIPRFTDDAHFPDSVWAVRRRAGVPRMVDTRSLAAALERSLDA